MIRIQAAGKYWCWLIHHSGVNDPQTCSKKTFNKREEGKKERKKGEEGRKREDERRKKEDEGRKKEDVGKHTWQLESQSKCHFGKILAISHTQRPFRMQKSINK